MNTVKVRMALDAWLDTQCGVPEITVSPDACSCEDSSKVYGPLQCQIQGAVPYGKVAPSRCTVRCNSVPIPEAVVVLNRNETIMAAWMTKLLSQLATLVCPCPPV